MRKYLNPPILEVVGICPSNITGGGFLVFFEDERTTFRNNYLSLIIMLNKLNWFSELFNTSLPHPFVLPCPPPLLWLNNKAA